MKDYLCLRAKIHPLFLTPSQIMRRYVVEPTRPFKEEKCMTGIRVTVLPKLNDVAATKKCNKNVIPASCHSGNKDQEIIPFYIKETRAVPVRLVNHH